MTISQFLVEILKTSYVRLWPTENWLPLQSLKHSKTSQSLIRQGYQSGCQKKIKSFLEVIIQSLYNFSYRMSPFNEKVAGMTGKKTKWPKSERTNNRKGVTGDSDIGVIKHTLFKKTMIKSQVHRYREQTGNYQRQGVGSGQNRWRGSKITNFHLQINQSWGCNV